MTLRGRVARAVTATLAAALCVAGACGRGFFSPPVNVLVVVMDTARADRCSFLGYDRPTTPRLDELARESVVFEQAWSAAPWTYPAHIELFTGRPPREFDVVGRELKPLPPGAATIATELAAAGHATGCFTGNAWIGPQLGTTAGFATYELTMRGETPGEARETHDLALAWMREQRAAGRPFFAFVNDMELHTPYAPPLDAQARFVPATITPTIVGEARSVRGARSMALSLGTETLDPQLRRALSSLYDAEMAGLDAEIGRLVASMRTAGLLDDTMIVIVGDHGEGLGDHGWIEHGVRLDREILHVPLLVRLPGGERGGSRVKDLVRLEDVLPTVLNVCGVPVPEKVRGLSLLGDTSGRVATATHRAFREFQGVAASLTTPAAAATLGRVWKSACDGRWHLVTEEETPPRLFDLAADPLERRDVAAEHPDVVERLGAQLPE